MLTKHKYISHKEVRCEECDKSYSRAVYIRHMRTVHVDKSNRTFKCDLCPYTSHAARYENLTIFEKSGIFGIFCHFGCFWRFLAAFDLVLWPECAKPVKAKAIVIHFRRAHGRLPPGMNF